MAVLNIQDVVTRQWLKLHVSTFQMLYTYFLPQIVFYSVLIILIKQAQKNGWQGQDRGFQNETEGYTFWPFRSQN